MSPLCQKQKSKSSGGMDQSDQSSWSIHSGGAVPTEAIQTVWKETTGSAATGSQQCIPRS